MSRVSRPAPPGSLFKNSLPKKKKLDLGKNPRQRDDEHLKLIRDCPCVSCGIDPCGEAAHIRMGMGGGLGRKPNDCRSISLCHSCHMRQHDIGEKKFWGDLGIDPLRIAESLYKLSPSLEGMRAVAFVAYGHTKEAK